LQIRAKKDPFKDLMNGVDYKWSVTARQRYSDRSDTFSAGFPGVMMKFAGYLVVVMLLAPPTGRGVGAEAAGKPVVAVFPIGGDAKETARDRAGLALRSKLDRTENFAVLDGYKMKDLAADAKAPVDFDTAAAVVKELASSEKASILLWGDLKGTRLRIKVLDLRQGENAKPVEITRVIAEPTDMRFATEQVLETIKDVKVFEHPSEVAVQHDAKAEALWKSNPNLVANGDFSDSGCWHGILKSEYYAVPLSEKLPQVDKVVIYKMPGENGGKANNVLAMNMSKDTAENNGLACLSDTIKIEPKTRYRLSFRYKSDGPVLHVFVKGYTKGPNIKGETVDREIYRRQIPPSGSTGGKWVEVVDELNPQHVSFPVQTLKVDLYLYLSPGVVMFDDVVLKAVGEPTRDAKDKAIKAPVPGEAAK
jgi:hypothetical protein